MNKIIIKSQQVSVELTIDTLNPDGSYQFTDAQLSGTTAPYILYAKGTAGNKVLTS